MQKKHSVFVSGNFNILHPGHLRLLKFAKELGDKLIVGVFSDALAGDGAHVSEKLRLESVQSISQVDEAFIIDKSIADIVLRVKPDIILKGKEHENEYNVESELIAKYGGKLVFSSGNVTFSSSDLIQKELKISKSNGFSKISEQFLQRHALSVQQISNYVDLFSKLRVVVIGDLIIDEYITCDPLGMSQEDPTIVVTPIESKLFVGGAAIVAAHAVGLGAKVNFVSIVGNDSTCEFSIHKLKEYGVEATLIEDESRPTNLKQRYRCAGKTLLRVSHLHQRSISLELQKIFFKKVSSLLEECDLLIFSDFNYGCLPQSLVNDISDKAKSLGVFTAADSQSSSQTGDIGRFKGMKLITPTEHEARISVRNQEDGLVILAESLSRQADVYNILLKMGADGLLIHAKNQETGHWLTDRLPALNSSPKDVSGAGDSLLTASAMTLVAGGDIWAAAYMGSLAAAIQVSRVGNTPLRSDELLNELSK
jgi:rfaE bifunctional protein kinase chain/domain